MKRQILLGLAIVGNAGILSTELSEDQRAGLLNEDFAESLDRQGKTIIKLTHKGRKIYNALESVVAIGTQW
jgi:hypothetical protein